MNARKLGGVGPNFTVDTKTLGPVSLRRMSALSKMRIEEWVREKVDAGELVKRIVLMQLDSPEMGPQLEAERSGETFIALLRAWTKTVLKKDVQGEGLAGVGRGFIQAFNEYRKDQHALLMKHAATIVGLRPEVLDAIKQRAGLPKEVVEAMNLGLLPAKQYLFNSPRLETALEALRKDFRNIAKVSAEVAGFANVAARLMPAIAAQAGATEALAKARAAIPKPILPPQHFFQKLPDLNKIAKYHRDMENGMKALEKNGFKVGYSFVSLSEAAALGTKPPKSASAAINQSFLAFTRSKAFWNELEARLKGSPSGVRRIKILRAAHEAHVARNYGLSVPVLIAQLEGLFTDGLIRLGHLRLTPSGKLKDQANKDITGLYAKKEIQFAGDLSLIVQNFLNTSVDAGVTKNFVKTRNDILHGSNLTYAKAKFSTQLLVAILFVATELETLK